MNSNQTGRNVIYIPACPCLHLSETVCWYVLSFVPEGRLTRQEDIEKFIKSKLGVSHAEFKRPISFDYRYWEKFIKTIPFHRVVSAYGYTDSLKLKKLISEGFEAENKTSNRGPRIKNYKEYLFDFETEADISRHMLEKINKEEDFDI